MGLFESKASTVLEGVFAPATRSDAAARRRSEVIDMMSKMMLPTKNENGDTVISGHVYLIDMKLGGSLDFLTKVFGRYIVTGNFFCSGTRLKNLRGSPDMVLGSFECIACGLTSLDGGPTMVGVKYDCSENQLTSLEGMARQPHIIDCSHNKLTSIMGSPRRVHSFNCIDNKLGTLKGGPVEVDNVFACSNNNLMNLDGCPKKVGGNFYCELNYRAFSEEYVRSLCDVGGKVSYSQGKFDNMYGGGAPFLPGAKNA